MGKDNVVYWARHDFDNWQLWLAVSPSGLTYVGLPGSGEELLGTFLHRHFAEYRIIQSEAAVEPIIQQFHQYFAGQRRVFEIPLHFHGTPFQTQVWGALGAIPYGLTTTYADVARAIGRPRSVRAVGLANGQNPLPIIVPCHRVIGANGTLTGYRGGLALKERLLCLEGSCSEGVDDRPQKVWIEVGLHVDRDAAYCTTTEVIGDRSGSIETGSQAGVSDANRWVTGNLVSQ